MSYLEKQNRHILKVTAHLIEMRQVLKVLNKESTAENTSEEELQRTLKNLKECRRLIASLENQLDNYTREQIDAAVRQHKRD